MNKFFLLLILLSSEFLYSHMYTASIRPSSSQFIQAERKLDETEVKQRGIDFMVTEVIDKIRAIDLKKMARSSIFETSYGFRWKMFNVQTGKVILIKVDKNFQLISIRNSKNAL